MSSAVRWVGKTLVVGVIVALTLTSCSGETTRSALGEDAAQASAPTSPQASTPALPQASTPSSADPSVSGGADASTEDDGSAPAPGASSQSPSSTDSGQGLTAEPLGREPWKVCNGTTVPCKIGDTGPGGGIVFYDAGSRQPWGQYLEAAPVGWARTLLPSGVIAGYDDPNYFWCPRSAPDFDSYLPTGWKVGSGLPNTRLIINACGVDTAAGLASAYRGGGLSDWHLPAKEELTELFYLRALVEGFAVALYWSSSQSPNVSLDAWHKYFGNGVLSEGIKDSRLMVRPIRAF